MSPQWKPYWVRQSSFMVPEGFDLTGCLGWGTYGVVCAADDNANNRKVAIKQISRPFASRLSAKRCKREVEVMEHLAGHENIVQFHEARRSEDGNVYIFMERMTTNLPTAIQQYEREYGQLSIELVRHVMLQLLKGVREMHKCELVHCDLKLDNVLVQTDWTVKISDFGMARPAGDVVEHEEGEVLVAKSYRPPELLAHASRYEKPADVWCLGIILAILLAKRHNTPFASKNSQLELVKGMMHVLGWPPNPDLGWVEAETVRAFLKEQPARPGVGLQAMQDQNGVAYFSDETSEDAIDLLSRMLVMNPHSRASVQECLEHAFFEEEEDDEDDEAPCPEEVRMPYSEIDFDSCDWADPAQARRNFDPGYGETNPQIQLDSPIEIAPAPLLMEPPSIPEPSVGCDGLSNQQPQGMDSDADELCQDCSVDVSPKAV
eukprot:Hpha_TRINITY_DN16450_c2_g1::TRINITY_DN16450_c2_g1_i2::g.163842::m.163842